MGGSLVKETVTKICRVDDDLQEEGDEDGDKGRENDQDDKKGGRKQEEKEKSGTMNEIRKGKEEVNGGTTKRYDHVFLTWLCQKENRLDLDPVFLWFSFCE